MNALGSYIRRHHLALLCLFLILGGGTALALDRNSVRSKHIVNGQVRGADVAEKTLKHVPRAIYANVDPEGDVTQARGISQSNVFFDSGSDQYCFRGLPFRPRGGQATIDYSEAGSGDDELNFDTGTVAGCPAGTQAFVWGAGTGGPIGFYILLYR